MTSASDIVQSTALVPYNPTLPHISVKSHLEAVTDEAFRRSFEAQKADAQHLSAVGIKWRERLVTETARGVSYLYIDQELGEKMARLILQNFQAGKYDRCPNPDIFIDAILEDLRSVSHDRHFRFHCYEHALPSYDPARSLRSLKPEELTQQQKAYLDALDEDRLDFSKEVEAHMIPDTKIGYFKINLFEELKYPETRGVIDKAMKNIVNAEAIIIDLRENCGGAPDTVAYLASYFFDKTELWNQLYCRAENLITSYYVEPEKLEQVLGGKKPIYVLTSRRTFSAGEDLAYGLQATGRATLIGQTTGGGANPGSNYVVDDHFSLFIPREKAINPHTGTNWEGIGVVPDISLPEDEDALNRAKMLCQDGL